MTRFAAPPVLPAALLALLLFWTISCAAPQHRTPQDNFSAIPDSTAAAWHDRREQARLLAELEAEISRLEERIRELARERERLAAGEARPPAPAPPGPGQGDAWTEPFAGMELIRVPGGCFAMGCGPWDDECRKDDPPVREVCLDDFWIGTFEVTQAQWERVMSTALRQQRDLANRAWPLRGEGPDHPMYYVSWDDAQEFLGRLNSAAPVPGFSLPTAAQWEYACRGGGREEKYCGGDNVDAVAWYLENSASGARPVGGKAPNALGLHDMSGNVYEWVQDAWDEGDPAAGGGARMLRGGSWFNNTWNVRSAFRIRNSPDLRFLLYGFRVAFVEPAR